MDKSFRALPLRFLFLLAAIATYALWGSPTPDAPGWAEAAMALCLALACGVPALGALKNAGPRTPLKLFLIYGMTVPLIAGAFAGHDPALIVRDVIPFLFLCLPVFLVSVAGYNARTQHIFIYAICGLGLVFALRALGPAYGYLPPAGELYYLSNAPTVLFTAIFMAGAALDRFAGPIHFRTFMKGILALAVTLTIMWAMLLDTQRGTIAAIVMSALLFFAAQFVRGPRRVIVPVTIVALLVVFLLPVFSDAVQAIARKTAKVGLNMRLEELYAVIDTIGASFYTALFGVGWGAKMASPAVAGIEVNFTHSLLTYILLKTGIVGLALTLAWLWRCAMDIFIIARHALVPAAGLFWALVIPVLFYASHKSLDFGLVLLLIAVLADGFQRRVATAKPGV